MAKIITKTTDGLSITIWYELASSKRNFWGILPEFPGVVSQAKTVEELTRSLLNGLKLHMAYRKSITEKSEIGAHLQKRKQLVLQQVI